MPASLPSGPSSPDPKAGKAAAVPAAPRFAAVEVTPMSGPAAPSAIVLALRLPSGVETTVMGLDADAVTLLVLELVTASARGPAVRAP